MTDPSIPVSRRALRAAAAADVETTIDELEEMEAPAPVRKRRRAWIWAGAIAFVALCLAAALLWAGKSLYDQAMEVRGHLTTAAQHVKTAQTAVLSGDSTAAQAAAQGLAAEADAAVEATTGRLWEFVEGVPLGLTDNLMAVRTVAEVVDLLSDKVVLPASAIDLSALAPVGGGIDVAALSALSGTVASLETEVGTAQSILRDIDRQYLIPQVTDGLAEIEGALDKLAPLIAPARGALEVLPAALGSEVPRNYLVMFQGNSEARSLGGNAAVFMVLRAEAGRLSIIQHVDSSDFRQGREGPVVPLDPEAVAIYGDKIGRWTPDFTMVPDFAEASRIALGWWAEYFETPVDGVILTDPVALSYILRATGPIALPTGDTLSADNVVSLLLNEAYFRYEDPLEQNAFFAAAAGSVFGALTSGSANPVALAKAIVQSADEGRLLYTSNVPRETELLEGSRMAGVMPRDNIDETIVGVYVNDNTASKKSYYLDLAVSAEAATCGTTPGTISGVATLTSWLTQEEANRLPYYIAGPYFEPEEISTYVAIYGPVGSTLSSVSVDGQPATVLTSGEHLARPVVKIEVINRLESAHSIEFAFATAAGDHGPLSVWSTPMSWATAVTAESSPCAAK